MATIVPIAGQNPADVELHTKLYRSLLTTGIVLLGSLLYFAATTWSVNIAPYFDSGPTLLLFAALFAWLSFKQIDAAEVAGAYTYGMALAPLKPGPHFVPFLLMQVKRESRSVQEFQCPGEPEQVQKGDDKVPLQEGKVRPIRAVTKQPDVAAGETGILDRQMTLELNFVVQYAVISIFDYVANFGSFAAVEKQLRDIGESTLAEEVSGRTPRTLIENLKVVNGQLTTNTGERFRNSGVHIISVRLVSPDVTHDVSSAMANIPIAMANAEQKKIGAVAERASLTEIGEGTAAAELARLNATAKGKKAVKDALGVDGDAVLASEAVRDVLAKTDVILAGADGGMKDVLSLVKGAQSALKPNRKGGQP